jgi:hypothetical protein
MRLIPLVLLGFLLMGDAVAQDCLDTATPDCDGDGYAPPDDCDDEDEFVNPGVEDICDNEIDDNCDGETDETCRLQEGRLEGGLTCEGNSRGWAALLLLPLFWRRR